MTKATRFSTATLVLLVVVAAAIVSCHPSLRTHEAVDAKDDYGDTDGDSVDDNHIQPCTWSSS